MTLPELIARAVKAYPFRPQRDDERDADYRAALIDHVEHYDLSMAYELRVGREQAAWTPNEVRAFRAWIESLPVGPRDTFRPGIHHVNLLEDAGPYEVTDDALLASGRRNLSAILDQRCDKPRGRVPVIISALLRDGRILFVPVDSEDRLAVLKWIAARFPLYGFLLAFDGWIHHSVTKGGLHDVPRASKRDAMFVHVASRTLRRILIQPYDYKTDVDGTEYITFTTDEAIDIDPRDGTTQVTDPYADVFVMPATTNHIH